MGRIEAAAERRVPVSAPDVYAFLRDYRDQRPRILPQSNYSDYEVVDGGMGTGTIVGYRFKAGPRERTYRMRVEEPEPGRMLTEHDENSTLMNAWTVTHERDGTHVRLQTSWDGGGGIGGVFERLFAPRGLRKIHGETLDRLAHELGR